MNIKFIVLDISLVGGIERVVVNLSNYFSKQSDYNVEIISIFKKNINPFYNLNKNIKIFYLSNNKFNNDGIQNKIKTYYLMYQKLKEYLKLTDADIIIGFSTNINIIMGVLRKYSKATLISTEHAQYTAHNILVRLVKRVFYKKLNYIVTLNLTDKKKYEKYLKNVICIPNFINIKNKKQASLDNKLIFSAGRLHKHKGFDLLIKAFKIVAKKYPEWILEIAGEGNEKSKLTKLIKKYKLEKNVFIIPFQSNIEKKYLEAAIYVLSSRQECFPMVLLEAMSYGIPVVSFDSPNGPRDIIKNENDGFLIKPYDVNKMAKKIMFLIENYELRKRMGINAYENIKRFSEENIGNMWKNLFIHLDKIRR